MDIKKVMDTCTLLFLNSKESVNCATMTTVAGYTQDDKNSYPHFNQPTGKKSDQFSATNHVVNMTALCLWYLKVSIKTYKRIVKYLEWDL